LDLSVIIPLVECRGRALDSIASWARGQTLARDRYQVLVVGAGVDTDFRRCVEELLGENDRFVATAEQGAAALYNVGARHADAPLLFITESHCVGHPSCLERLLALITAHGLDGAFCGSDGLPGNLFSRMEQRLFEAELASRRAAGPAVISVRGTAIAKARFLAAGGFESRYGHFSELLLADALEAQGARMGFARDAIVSHENMDNASDLIEALCEYGRDECRFAADGRASARRCDVWEQRRAWDKATARARLAALVRHSLRIGPRGAATLAGTFQDLILPAVAGIQGRLWASRARLWWTRFRLALARRNAEAYFDLYARLWRSAIRHGGYEFLAEHGPSATPAEWAAPYDLDGRDDRLVGFHEVERSDGRPFRWSEPVALLHVRMEPRDTTVTLRLAHCARDVARTLGVFFDGNPVAGVRELGDPPRIVFSVARELMRPGLAHELVWACRRKRVDRRADSRALGIAVAGIEINGTGAAERTARDTPRAAREPSLAT
jgi:hypothetical protein